jgi:multidrug resistance protein, MATE family
MATAASQMSEATALLAENGCQAEEQAMANGTYGTVSDEVVKKDPNLETTWKAESKILAKYSTPLFITYVLQYSFQTVTVLVAGHIGTKELGAVSLATMTANVTALAVYEGLATSLDTLCAQSFGAGKPQLVGLHLQRMVFLMLLATIPIGALWIASPWILEAMIPERDIAHLAGRYLQVYLIGAPGFAIFEASKRLVQAQGDFTGSLFVLSICAPVNVVLSFLFVWVRLPVSCQFTFG